MMKKTINKYLLIFLGFFMILAYFWFRFIRTRLPNGIPFYLPFTGMLILIFICSFYIYSLILTVKKNIDNESNYQSLFNLLFLPLKELDKEIKNYFKLEEKIFTLVFGLSILPRIIIFSILFIETFYLQYLSFFYKIILLGILILIEKYIIYTIKKIKNDLFEKIKNIEKVISINMDAKYVLEMYPEILPLYYDEEEEDMMHVPLKEFLYYQEYQYIENGSFKSYGILPTIEGIQIFCEDNNLVDEQSPFTCQLLIWNYMEINDKYFENFLKFMAFSIEYDKFLLKPFIKVIKILLLLLPLISWLYILLVCIKFFDFDPFFVNLLGTIDTSNPFFE